MLAGLLGLGWVAVRGKSEPPAASLASQIPATPQSFPAQQEALEVPPATPDCVQPPPFLPAPKPPAALNGQLGLWAAVIDPKTLQPIRAVAYAPGSVFPLASTYKQAVLWAMLRQVDAGRFDLNQKFSVTRAAQSLGSYPYDHSTALTLAQRMIQHSDNTATDLLHRKVGLQKVQQLADDLKLCRTRLILPTKAWWTAQSGLSNIFAGTKLWPQATGQKRAQLAALIDADAQKYRADYVQRKLDEYFDKHYNGADDLKVHNFSTPYELSTLVAHEFLRSGLSPKSQNLQRRLMTLGCCKGGLLPIPIDTWGGKGGNGWKILTYSGYFKTKGGEHVVYAFMLHGSGQTYTMKLTRPAFAWLRASLGEILAAGDGGKEGSAER